MVLSRARSQRFAIAWALASLACTGAIATDGAPDDPGNTGGKAAGGRGGAAGRGGGASGGGGTGVGHIDRLERNPGLPLTCSDPSAAHPVASPLVRLTNVQLANTLRDLFPGVSVPAPQLPDENVVSGFTNNAEGQTSSTDLIDAIETSARAVAAAAADNLNKVLPCQPASAADEVACGNQFVTAFGRRAFRRPLRDDEAKRFQTFFASARGTYGFKTAVQLVIGGMLQTPQFLYRVEVGKGSPSGGAVALDDWELAARLSYLLWDTLPDDQLAAAADKGELSDAKKLDAQAQRLLNDARARPVVARFHEQWFDLARAERNAANKSKQKFPSFSPDVATSLSTSTRKFIEHAFWDDGGGLNALLTEARGYVDAKLAPIYGMSSGPSELTLTSLDSGQRAGLMTQAGLLAGLAHETLHAPVLRGVFILDRLLCANVQPAPPGVNTSLPDVTKPMTTRQRFEQVHETGSCKSCHVSIDGAGFTLESFDALGAFRTKEDGLDVDDRGKLTGTSDVDGEVRGAVELGRKLAGSEQVAQCVVTNWLRYGLSRTEQPEDGCTIADLTDGLIASKGDVRGMLLDLAASSAFRTRTPISP